MSVLKKFASLGYEHALFKQDLATSGRGQRRFRCTSELSSEDTAWTTAALRYESRCVIEPELDRLVDLSFLWKSPGDEDSPPDFLAWSRPLVTAGRRYAGTRLHRPFDDCISELKRFLLVDDCARLHYAREWLEKTAAPELRQRGFEGPFGVDAFVYRDFSGQLKLKPIVELNPRTTMGHIAMSVRKHLASVVPAEFRIFSRGEWNQLLSTTEPRLEMNPDGRWSAGIIPFTEWNAKTKLVAAAVVGEDALRTVPRCVTTSRECQPRP